MSSAAALDLAVEVADAHASATLAAADHIAVSFSSGGRAFKVKGQADALARVDARLNPHQQQITLTGATRDHGRSRSPTAPISSRGSPASEGNSTGRLRTLACSLPQPSGHISRCPCSSTAPKACTAFGTSGATVDSASPCRRRSPATLGPLIP